MIYVITLLIIIVLFFAILIATFYMYRIAKLERVLYQDLYFADFPTSFESIRLFFISDLHRRVVSDQLIETVRNKVDIVIIGGDLLEGGVPLTNVERNVSKLKNIGPLYFVWGNNDYEVDSVELEKILWNHGVTILRNTAVTMESKKGEKITLIGIDDITMERDRLDLALAECTSKKDFRILVSHNPMVKKKLMEEHGIRLVLSGHTHGGQIRIFGYGPYKLGGIEVDETCMYMISNGFGTSTVPLRLEAKPETHVLSLKKGLHTGIGEMKEKKL